MTLHGRAVALAPPLRERRTGPLAMRDLLDARVIALTSIPAALALGWAITRGFGGQILIVTAVVTLPLVLARSRWALPFVLAPVLLYPVSAANGPKLHGVHVAPLVALYLAANVLWLYVTRRRTSRVGALGLAGLLTLVLAGLLESVYSNNGTLAHSLTTFGFWISAFLLGSLLGNDRRQLASLGLLALAIAGLSLWQAATGSNPYNHIVGELHFASVESYKGLQRSTATFGHPLVAGASLMVLAALALVGRRWFSAPIALMVFVGATVTLSRSAFVGAVVMLIVVVAQGTGRRRVVITLGSIVLAFALAVVLLPRFSIDLESRVLHNESREVARNAGPERLFNAIAHRPEAVLFGNGVGTTALQFQSSGGIGGVDTYDNQFVDSAFDVGVLPLGLVVALLGAAAFRAQPDRRSSYLPAFVGAVTMLLFFDGLGWPAYSVLFWLVVGALTSRPRGRVQAFAVDMPRSGGRTLPRAARAQPVVVTQPTAILTRAAETRLDPAGPERGGWPLEVERDVAAGRSATGRAERPIEDGGLADARARIGFLVIGAQKAGTTSLFEYMRRHPQIHMPAEKEISFFSRRYERGYGWYRSAVCGGAAEQAICGEVSVGYMGGTPYADIARNESETASAAAAVDDAIERVIPGRIRSTLPDVRLICVLRDPVERAYSHYQMAALEGGESRTFPEAIDRQLAADQLAQDRRIPTNTNGYVVNGEYGRVLSGFLDEFDREQLLVVFSNELAEDPRGTLARVFAHVGVQSEFVPDNLGSRYRVAATERKIAELDL